VADRWHLGRAGQRFGPYPWAQVVDMARAGQIAPADLLWQEGTPSWVPAASLGDRLPLPRGGAVPPAAPAPPALSLSGIDQRRYAGRFGFHARRAAQWNLHDMPITDGETSELVRLGIDDDDARRYPAWRRSILWITVVGGVLAAALGTVAAALEDHSMVSGVGGLVEIVRVATLWLIPIFAWRAARCWSRHRRSRRILAIGWCLAFAAPLLLALVPVHWRLALDDSDAGVRAQQEALVRFLGAAAAYLTLMPAVLALIPGIMRACLRVKVLLPESILPGCFLVGAAPLWTFLFMVVFITANQLAGDPLLILGVLAVTCAPLLYLRHAALFIRPVESQQDQQRLLAVQRQVRLILAAGVVLLVIWVFTASVLNVRIIGLESGTSLLRPWSLELYRFPVDYATHSLFTMALAADVFMAMNLSVWVHTKRFVASPAARDYDRRMTEIEEAGAQE
jgi:hypothetical protein